MTNNDRRRRYFYSRRQGWRQLEDPSPDLGPSHNSEPNLPDLARSNSTTPPSTRPSTPQVVSPPITLPPSPITPLTPLTPSTPGSLQLQLLQRRRASHTPTSAPATSTSRNISPVHRQPSAPDLVRVGDMYTHAWIRDQHTNPEHVTRANAIWGQEIRERRARRVAGMPPPPPQGGLRSFRSGSGAFGTGSEWFNNGAGAPLTGPTVNTASAFNSDNGDGDENDSSDPDSSRSTNGSNNNSGANSRRGSGGRPRAYTMVNGQPMGSRRASETSVSEGLPASANPRPGPSSPSSSINGRVGTGPRPNGFLTFAQRARANMNTNGNLRRSSVPNPRPVPHWPVPTRVHRPITYHPGLIDADDLRIFEWWQTTRLREGMPRQREATAIDLAELRSPADFAELRSRLSRLRFQRRFDTDFTPYQTRFGRRRYRCRLNDSDSEDEDKDEDEDDLDPPPPPYNSHNFPPPPPPPAPAPPVPAA